MCAIEKGRITSAFELIDLGRLKIFINDIEHPVKSFDVETGDRAITYHVQEKQCMFHVVSVSMQRSFNIMGEVTNNRVSILSVQEHPMGANFVDESMPDFDPYIKTYQEFIRYKDVMFSIIQINGKGLAQEKNLGQWIDLKAIKMRVNNQDLEILPKDEGGNDRAIVRFVGIDRCKIRVISVSMDRIFDIACSISAKDYGYGAVIDEIQEISKEGYLKDLRDEYLGKDLHLTVNQSPVNKEGVTFSLSRTNELFLPNPTSLKSLIAGKGLRIRLNGNELELASKDVEGEDDYVIVHIVEDGHCKLKAFSLSKKLRREFEISLSTKLNADGSGKEIAIDDIKVISPWKSICEFDNRLRPIKKDCYLSVSREVHNINYKRSFCIQGANDYCYGGGKGINDKARISFALMPLSNESVAQFENLQQLIKANILKILVDNQELLEISPKDCGHSNRAVVYSLEADRCVIRVFYRTDPSGLGRIPSDTFDIPILISDEGALKIDDKIDIKQISGEEYSKQKLQTWTEEC